MLQPVKTGDCHAAEGGGWRAVTLEPVGPLTETDTGSGPALDTLHFGAETRKEIFIE